VSERDKRKREVVVTAVWLTSLISRLTYPSKCRHGEEPWYCDCCRHVWEKRVSGAREGILSKLKKAKP